MRDDKASRFEKLRRPTEGPGRVRQVHQDQPAYHRVEGLAYALKGLYVSHNELDVASSDRLRSCAGVAHGLRIPLDADHPAVWSDEPRCKESDMTCTRAKVENTHPTAQPGGEKDPFGKRVEQRCLEVEAPLLGFAIVEHILITHHATSTAAGPTYPHLLLPGSAASVPRTDHCCMSGDRTAGRPCRSPRSAPLRCYG